MLFEIYDISLWGIYEEGAHIVQYYILNLLTQHIRHHLLYKL